MRRTQRERSLIRTGELLKLLVLGACSGACSGAVQSEQSAPKTVQALPSEQTTHVAALGSANVAEAEAERESAKPETAEREAAKLEAMPSARVPTLDEVLASLPLPSASTSLGSPSNGQVRGAVALPLEGPGLRFNDRRSRDARFGTAEVIRAIVRAARVVEDELPGSQLLVNDIGLEQGGAISHHGSHRAGRDADILFYLLGDDGKPTPSVGAPLDPNGIGHDYKKLSTPEDDLRVHFDAARTWRFIQALLADPEAVVQRIFVVEHLRDKLLAEAARVAAPADLVSRFADVTCQPSAPHDDHLHVRWFCSEEDLALGCEDLPPLYPWRLAQLTASGLKPVQAKQTKSKDPAPIVTQAQANAAVKREKPHPSVLAFLEQRKAWEKQPHPGRPYCR